MVLVVLVILAIIGLGWEAFSSGIISGFETVLDVGQPVIKNLTQEAREYFNSPNLLNLELDSQEYR
ncbi:MAG TPA: hypothetical protein VIA08_04490 [Nitrososphaeraceae archaeon]